MTGGAKAARASHDHPVPEVAERIADEVMSRGACAVWLAGSHARGEADAYSDVDLGALYEVWPGDPGPIRQRRDGVLVSTAWVSVDQTRASFRDPALLGAAVPGWRRAALLRDPQGIAASLRDEARRWAWDPELEAAGDRWVAGQLELLAESVQKLAGALARERPLAAATQRERLATQLPLLLAVRRRVLHDGESHVLEAVAGAAGEPWESFQRAALCLGGEDLQQSSRAVLEMYAILVKALLPQLDDRQRAIVEPALALAAERPAASPPSV